MCGNVFVTSHTDSGENSFNFTKGSSAVKIQARKTIVLKTPSHEPALNNIKQ